MPFFARCLRQRNRPQLQVPPQHDLSWRAAVRRRGTGDSRVIECFALTKRAPALGEHAQFGMYATQISLRELRVQLDLVDRGHDARQVSNLSKVPFGEVGDADGPHAALTLQLDHGPPRIQVPPMPRVGPMDQIQVNAP